MSKKLFLLFTLLVMCIPTIASAATGHTGNDCIATQKLTEKEATELISKTGLTVTSVKHAPIRGLFELQVEKDGQKSLLYMDCSKKFLMQGMVFDRETLKPVMVHKIEFPQPKQQTTLDVKKIPTDGAVVMGNPNGAKKLYVFTDPDCPYCRKAHEELKKLAKLAPDVTINVVLYPLPMHPGAYDKARAVLEARSQEILDRAFEGREVPKPVQESSKRLIDENRRFAEANGISGTPALVLPNGRIELGVRDAESLKKILEEKQ